MKRQRSDWLVEGKREGPGNVVEPATGVAEGVEVQIVEQYKRLLAHDRVLLESRSL
jgi:hypothetical protein